MSSKKSKKKHGKKQQFKYAAPVGAPASVVSSSQSTATPIASLSKATLASPVAVARVEVPGLHLIRHDVRRVLVLAGSFVAIELMLWYLFGHTPLGPTIYKLF
jgi:hypothetical protein